MHHTSLRRVGGSIMLAVPPAIVSALGLEPGGSVGLRVEGDRLVIERTRPRYTLDQLLAEREADPPPEAMASGSPRDRSAARRF